MVDGLGVGIAISIGEGNGLSLGQEEGSKFFGFADFSVSSDIPVASSRLSRQMLMVEVGEGGPEVCVLVGDRDLAYTWQYLKPWVGMGPESQVN